MLVPQHMVRGVDVGETNHPANSFLRELHWSGSLFDRRFHVLEVNAHLNGNRDVEEKIIQPYIRLEVSGF